MALFNYAVNNGTIEGSTLIKMAYQTVDKRRLMHCPVSSI